MRAFRIFVVLLLILQMLWTGETVVSQASPRTRIRGLVVDSNGGGIGGVEIRAYTVGGGFSASAITKDDGRYAMLVERGKAVESLIYQRSGWAISSFGSIATIEDQVVSKVLYRLDTQLSVSQGSEVLTAYENLYFIDKQLKTQRIAEILKQAIFKSADPQQTDKPNELPISFVKSGWYSPSVLTSSSVNSAQAALDIKGLRIPKELDLKRNNVAQLYESLSRRPN